MIDRLLQMLAGFLFCIRFFIPTEGTGNGETLWIACGWLILAVAAAICSWFSLLETDRSGSRGNSWNLADLAVALLVGGHILGLIPAWNLEFRTAFNVAMEWAGIGGMWCVLRSLRHSRTAFAVTGIAWAIAISGYGIWQVNYDYDQMIKAYDKLRLELDRLETQEQLSPSLEERRMQIIGELREIGLEGSALFGPGRRLFEKRLKESHEPIGFFALANSLAGWLLFWVLIWICSLQSAGRWQIGSKLVALLLSVLMGYLLLISKSRTAWVALIVALIGLMVRVANRQMRLLIVYGLSLIVVLGGVGVWMGGLDAKVLSEAPKSLRYRLEYWHSSLQLARENPIFGAGIGNFQHSYSKHKLPQSSEEIADPHNALLDVWCNGGLTALAGLLLLGGVLVNRFLFTTASGPPVSSNSSTAGLQQPGATDSSSVSSLKETEGSRPPLAVSADIPLRLRRPNNPEQEALAEPVAPVAVRTYSIHEPESRMFPLILGSLASFGILGESAIAYAILWVVFAAVLCFLTNHIERTPVFGWSLAALSLLLHLFGAGGIGMPGILQLVLAGLSLSATKDSQASSSRSHTREFILNGLVTLLCGVGIYWIISMGILPITERDYWRNRANKERVIEEVTSALEKAIEADPWFVDTHLEMASHLYQVVNQEHRNPTEEEWDRIASHLEAAIEGDPADYGIRLNQAFFFRERAKVSGKAEYRTQAKISLDEGLDLAPNQLRLITEYALTCGELNDPQGPISARRAIELDDINHEFGHEDKYLNPELRERLMQLAKKQDRAE